MRIILINIILLIFNLSINITAQESCIKKTHSSIDTSLTEYEQLREVYSWITNNISIDAGSRKLRGNYTPIKIIKHKKASSHGFSELFNAMSRELGIESYIVSGYCKGLDYIYGDNFTEANHAWNVVKLDTSWVIVDASWGCGGFIYEYNFISKLKQFLKKDTEIKTKLVFKPIQGFSYFDVPPSKMLDTHFPIDVKWQLINNPISYSSFVSGVIDTLGAYDFSAEIEKLKHFDLDYQIFIDALNSIKYNPYNKFDIAYNYYNQANNLEMDKKSDTNDDLKKRLGLAINYCDSAIFFNKKFKRIYKANFKKKRGDYKKTYKVSSNALKRINKFPALNEIDYKKTYSRFLSKENKLNKMKQKIYPLGLLINRDIKFEVQSNQIPDTVKINKFKERIKINDDRITDYLLELNDIKASMELLKDTGEMYDDTLIFLSKQMIEQIYDIWSYIDEMEVFKTLNICSELENSYNCYDSLYKTKRYTEKNLNNKYKKLNQIYEYTEELINYNLKYYERIAQISGDNLFYSNKANEATELRNGLYRIKSEVIGNLELHNYSWKKLLTNQFKLFAKYKKSIISNTGNKLESFYNYITSGNEDYYSLSLNKYNFIKYNSLQLIRESNLKIRKINEKTRLLTSK